MKDKEYELEDVQYHKIDEFPDNFDVKSVHEDLNTCDKCGVIVMWNSEMFWQDDDCENGHHYCMRENFNKEDDYTALCDDCFYKLPSLCTRINCENNATSLIDKIKSRYLWFSMQDKKFLIDYYFNKLKEVKDEK